MGESVRLDKWLWAARICKTRTLAARAVALGRVAVNGQATKASRELRPGERVSIQHPGYHQELVVLLLNAHRGGAAHARTMYSETSESLAARQAALRQRRLAPDPAAGAEQGRPTKRDRRALAQWQRWSASADE